MLDMSDHIDDDLISVMATRFARSGTRGSDGRWTEGAEYSTTHKVNLQPLSEREIQNLGEGGERLQDLRKVYINDGNLYSLTPQDEWEFDSPDIAGARYTVYSMDNRPWRSYCKCVVHRNDR